MRRKRIAVDVLFRGPGKVHCGLDLSPIKGSPGFFSLRPIKFDCRGKQTVVATRLRSFEIKVILGFDVGLFLNYPEQRKHWVIKNQCRVDFRLPRSLRVKVADLDVFA